MIAILSSHPPTQIAHRDSIPVDAERKLSWASTMVREEKLDLVLVPLALAALSGYHLWLLYTILRHPTRTVIGVNAMARKRWVAAMMAVGTTHVSQLISSVSSLLGV